MAEADCPTCEASGYRACDICSNVVFPHNLEDPLAGGRELCGYCLGDIEAAAASNSANS